LGIKEWESIIMDCICSVFHDMLLFKTVSDIFLTQRNFM